MKLKLDRETAKGQIHWGYLLCDVYSLFTARSFIFFSWLGFFHPIFVRFCLKKKSMQWTQQKLAWLKNNRVTQEISLRKQIHHSFFLPIQAELRWIINTMFFSLSQYLRVHSLKKTTGLDTVRNISKIWECYLFHHPTTAQGSGVCFSKWPLRYEGKRSLFQYIFILTINPC